MSANLDWRDHNNRKQQEENRRYANLRQAASLLRDNHLIWSADMEIIRHDLAEALDYFSIMQQLNFSSLERIAEKLISDENDLTIGN